MLSQKQLTELYIQDLIHHVYCRIKSSGVHGVGVFAIRTIPKGTNPFLTLKSHKESKAFLIPASLILDDSRISDAVKQMIKDFFPVENGQIEMQLPSLNEINISFFLNHSNNPNVTTKDGIHFHTTRIIEAGEELRSDYKEYSEEYIPSNDKK